MCLPLALTYKDNLKIRLFCEETTSKLWKELHYGFGENEEIKLQEGRWAKISVNVHTIFSLNCC